MTPSSKVRHVSSRRRFIKQAGVLGVALSSTSLTGSVLAAVGARQSRVAPTAGLDPMVSRRIHLVNAHTKDDLNVVYYTHGMYIDENIKQLNYLMRDRRANATIDMDTALYDQLLGIKTLLGIEEPVHVLSGYRTPETNAKLRRRSSGVARFSLHMEGRAADIYIPGISVDKLHEAAVQIQAGGVGLYSNSNFVHIDTGAVRRWGS